MARAAALLALASALMSCTSAPPARPARHSRIAVTGKMDPATAARPRIVRRAVIRHRVEPLSIAFGHDSLWLAFMTEPPPVPAGQANTGELLRIDARSLKVTARWQIVGSPVAVAVTRRFVWIAGDAYDGRTPVWDADHVEQFTLGGVLLNNYPVAKPVGLAVAKDSVWVEYGGGSTRRAMIRKLHDGAQGHPLWLNGPGAFGTLDNIPVVACADGVYATSAHYGGRGRTSIQRFVAGRAQGTAWLDEIGDTSLSCAPGGGVLAITEDGSSAAWQLPGPWAAPPGGPAMPGRTVLPMYSYSLATAGGAPWIGMNNGLATATRIWRLDPGTLRPSRPVKIAVNVILSVARGRYLWTVGDDGSHGSRWIIDKLKA